MKKFLVHFRKGKKDTSEKKLPGNIQFIRFYGVICLHQAINGYVCIVVQHRNAMESEHSLFFE